MGCRPPIFPALRRGPPLECGARYRYPLPGGGVAYTSMLLTLVESRQPDLRRPSMAILFNMAITRVKGTYTLDHETVRIIETLSRRWGTSKSEVLRRAVRTIAQAKGPSPDLATLDQLQGRVRLSAAAADRWAKNVKAERRATPRVVAEGP